MTNYPILYNGARLWANPNDVEGSALQQITNSVNLPWAHGVAVMPDVHTGYGVTIGSVIDWAQDYALLNRAIMLTTVKQVLTHYFTPGEVEFHNTIQCHHNYVAEEIYDGQQLAIIRKGAIAAHSGELGIIPGSMGTGSYIVEGLGNELSYNSASHGAGRKMSRGKARKAFTVEDLAAQTAGIECRKDADILDEAPGAYKDIDSVMEAQRDLVRPVARLQTLLCVKG